MFLGFKLNANSACTGLSSNSYETSNAYVQELFFTRLVANGSLGLPGQVLSTGAYLGDNNYWANVASGGGGLANGGTANNTLYVGNVSAANVVSDDQLAANLATITASLSNYATIAQLNANVSTITNFGYLTSIANLTANNTLYVGNVSATNVVSNAQLTANLSTISATIPSIAGLQTTAGLATAVAGLASNSAAYLGTLPAINYVTTGQLTANLANYQLTSGMGSYQTVAALPTAVAALASNSASYIGLIPAANVVSNAQLIGNLANYTLTSGLSVYQLVSGMGSYQTTAGLATAVLALPANNTLYVGNVSATNVVSNAQLTANIATITALIPSIAGLQTTAGLAANVAGLISNSANYIGTLPAANVVSNTQLISNLANYALTSTLVNYQLISGMSAYQTTLGLAANVAILTANAANYIGTLPAANVVSNTQLVSNLANYTLTSGLAAVITTQLSTAAVVNTSGNFTLAGNTTFNANVILSSGLSANGGFGTSGQVLTSNGLIGAPYWSTVSGGATGSTTQIAYNKAGVESGDANLIWNYTTSILNIGGATATTAQILVGNSTVNTSVNSTAFTGIANNTLFVGTVSAANVVSNAQLVANLANYTLTSGLPAIISTNTSNNATNFGGQLPSYYINATNITTGTLPYAQLGAAVVNTSGAFTLSGNTTFAANVILQKQVSANGGFGTAGQVLTSGGAAANAYWSTASGGGGPIGSTGQIAFNNAGTESGDANLNWYSANTTLKTGNTTVYTNISSTKINIANATSNVVITPSSITVNNAIVGIIGVNYAISRGFAIF